MLNKDFAIDLCEKLEDRILEICEKMRTGNYNDASLPAFWMGLQGDIETFMEENKLVVRKKKNRTDPYDKGMKAIKRLRGRNL